jgi:Tfp pilus assembly protein PilN
MEVFLGVLVTLLGFYTVIVSLKLKDSKSTIQLLQELNKKLQSQVTELTSKNSDLWFELQQEKSYIDKGKKVSWLDKQGETNEGVVLDDYTLKDKVYVVVIRMKDGKTQGAPISIPFTKLTVI